MRRAVCPGSFDPVTVTVFAAFAEPPSLGEPSSVGAEYCRFSVRRGPSRPLTASCGPVPDGFGASTGGAAAAAVLFRAVACAGAFAAVAVAAASAA